MFKDIRKLDKQTKAVIRAWIKAHREYNLAKAAAIEATNPDVDWVNVSRQVWSDGPYGWRWYA